MSKNMTPQVAKATRILEKALNHPSTPRKVAQDLSKAFDNIIIILRLPKNSSSLGIKKDSRNKK
jgi:hypothetical protein